MNFILNALTVVRMEKKTLNFKFPCAMRKEICEFTDYIYSLGEKYPVIVRCVKCGRYASLDEIYI